MSGRHRLSGIRNLNQMVATRISAVDHSHVKKKKTKKTLHPLHYTERLQSHEYQTKYLLLMWVYSGGTCTTRAHEYLTGI